MRRGLVLGLFYLVSVTYFVDGATQSELSKIFSSFAHILTPLLHIFAVVSTLITGTYSPNLPAFINVVCYSIGGMVSFTLCSLTMLLEEKQAGKKGEWGSVYPRLVTVLGLGIELVMAFLIGRILQNGLFFIQPMARCTDSYSFSSQDPSNEPHVAPLLAVEFGVLSFRILALVFLLLSQTTLLYSKGKTNLEIRGPSTSMEREPLLGGGSSD